MNFLDLVLCYWNLVNIKLQESGKPPLNDTSIEMPKAILETQLNIY